MITIVDKTGHKNQKIKYSKNTGHWKNINFNHIFFEKYILSLIGYIFHIFYLNLQK